MTQFNTRSVSYMVEQVLRTNMARQLPVLIHIHGSDYHVFRYKEGVKEAKSTSIYGQYAGTDITKKQEEYDTFNLRILANPTFWETSDSIFSGLIDDDPEWGYCTGDLKIDDVIQVIRIDNKINRFKVTDLEKVGHTLDMVYRFRISNYEQ